MINKITLSVYFNYLLNSLDTTKLLPTNEKLIELPKVFKQSKVLFIPFGTRQIYSKMSPPSLVVDYYKQFANHFTSLVPGKP